MLGLLGGLGLFLLGMISLTDGLRSAAGEALHRFIFRFTRNPLTGAATGAVATALLQSSSATTVAAVGFVSAGLMTFPQALGILFGANIGTTVTGWLVALLGYKLDLASVVQPLLLIGVALRLFGRGRLRHLGWALAGFALIFIGIGQLNASMAPFEGAVTPDDFPSDTLLGRLLLVLIGVGITLVTQSSSAGVAAALAALHAGAISFPQAAAMVIGMDIGTTSTAAIAAIGGSARARRTGFAHVVYNLLTGVGAFLLLTPFTEVVDRCFEHGVAGHAQLALVAFHTGFNTLGVLIVLPFSSQFARMMIRLFPERGPSLTLRLESAVIRDASAASTALGGTVRDVTHELMTSLVCQLDDRPARDLDSIGEALAEARRFADRIVIGPVQSDAFARLLSCLHAMDHLERLLGRCRQARVLETVIEVPRLKTVARAAADAIQDLVQSLTAGTPIPVGRLGQVRDALKAERSPFRVQVLESVGRAELHLDRAMAQLDAVRWLHRVSYHVWRIAIHLAAAEHAPGSAPTPGAPAGPSVGPVAGRETSAAAVASALGEPQTRNPPK
ncbi:MAG: Na/Pi cotransporter family protein [Planctomycetota bacterium]